MTAHLNLLTYSATPVNAEKSMTPFNPIFLRSSCSGSAAQLRNVVTSLAICDVVAGVPVHRIRALINSSLKPSRLTVLIFDNAIKENTSHGDSSSGEVGIVVQALTNLDSGRRVNVSSQEREYIVLIKFVFFLHKPKTWNVRTHTYRGTMTCFDN